MKSVENTHKFSFTRLNAVLYRPLHRFSINLNLLKSIMSRFSTSNFT